MAELEEILLYGSFTNETETHWVFTEVNGNKSREWKIKKRKLRGTPPMNDYGQLTLDDSYIPEEIDGEMYITKGMGRLITFMSSPF